MATTRTHRRSSLRRCPGHRCPGEPRAARHFSQHRAQVTGKLVTILIPCLGPFADRQRNQIGEILGQFLANNANVWRFLVGNLEHQLGHGFTAKWQDAAEHLKQHHAQRIKIRAPIYLLAGQLLGRHEAWCAQHQPGLGFTGVGNARNAEVRHFDGITIKLVHDVGRLDIAVHHILLVRVGKRLGHPRHDRQHFGHGKQVAVFAVVEQVFALEKLHGDIGQVVLFAGIKYRHDVLMLQTPGRLGLAEETFTCVDQFVARKLLAQCHRLDGNDTADFRVFAKVYDTHGSLAEFLVDLVAAQHGFLDRATFQQHGPTGMCTRATQHNGLGQVLGPVKF